MKMLRADSKLGVLKSPTRCSVKIVCGDPFGGLGQGTTYRLRQARAHLLGQGRGLAREDVHLHPALLFELAQQVGGRELVQGEIIQLEGWNVLRGDLKQFARGAADVDRIQDEHGPWARRAQAERKQEFANARTDIQKADVLG
jgi:hypothetical protein